VLLSAALASGKPAAGEMAHPAGFEPTTPAFGALKVTLYDQDVSAYSPENQRLGASQGSGI